jgi:oxygen-independent coproporphyrinogen-3 oxidase
MHTDFPTADFGLLKKYDRPGPRYTSYPTAPLFSSAFGPQDYKRAIIATNQSGSTSDLSLYFHFPFCDTLCYFCGCTMVVTRDRKRIAEYLEYLKKEVAMIAPLIPAERRVTQVHWGGGTPTHLTPEEILDTAEFIKECFHIDPEAEMSVEIDPRELTQRHLGTLRHVGFNRISVGIQDVDPKVQQSVNRIQPTELSVKAIAWAEALGFDSINVDLMYGLPFQSVRSFRVTLEEVVKLRPDRIAVFNYAHVPWLKPHQKLIHPEDLPTPDQKLEILSMTIAVLQQHGYEYIGMDHFAKEMDELALARKAKTLHRNFQGYSTKGGADLYGFGMSSISHFDGIYAQNHKTLAEYYAAIDSGQLPTAVGYRMTADDRLRKFVIMRLMCNLELDKRMVENRFGIDFDSYFADALEKLDEFVQDRLVDVGPISIRVVNGGRLVLRNIAMCFDAHLESMKSSAPIFSRTV